LEPQPESDTVIMKENDLIKTLTPLRRPRSQTIVIHAMFDVYRTNEEELRPCNLGCPYQSQKRKNN
jgi:hypothetical protein